MPAATSPPAYTGPDYAKGDQLYKVRARKIIASNQTSEPPCTVCISKSHPCYRDEAFKKCAYCTAREFTQPFCHLPGEPEPTRKIRRNRTREALTHILNESDLTRGSRSPSLEPEVEPDLVEDPARSPAKDEDVPVLGGSVANVLASEVARLHGIVAAQGSRIEQLSETVSRLIDRVGLSETSAACTSPDEQIFERPITVQTANIRGPRRRLHPSMLYTVTSYLSNQAYQAPKSLSETQLPPSPPQPAGYRVPYTEVGEELDSILPEHTIRHVKAFRPINCVCSRPHTLDNGETQFLREGFT